VALAGELAGLPALTALRRAHEILDYVTLAEERYREVQTYSTGMRQKIKLAQALIHSPRLLFLDEPTSGLDPTGRERMLKLVRNLAEKKGVSVVVSTHILSDIEACCDSVLILGRGRLLVYDTIARLRSDLASTCRVRVDGGGEGFAESLQSLGCSCEPLGRDEIEVSGPDGLGDLIFQAARSSDAVIREIAPSRSSLEDIFLTAVQETSGRDHAASPPGGA